MIRHFAQEIAGVEVSDSWVTRFLNRHSDRLTSRWATGMDKERHNADSWRKYEQYFSLIGQKIQQYHIETRHTYNIDEKGFAIGKIGRSKRVFDKALYKQKHTRQSLQDGNRKWITLLSCICADGTVLPPGLIYAAETQNVQSSWVDDLDKEEHSVFTTVSPSGWSNDDAGLGWLEQVFNRFTKKKARRKYRLLIVDGHRSHLTMAFLSFCDRNKIMLAVYPPHSTHTLQPLDVVCFKPLAQNYSNELTDHLHKSQSLVPIKKGDFFRLFWAAWVKTITEKLILSAFKATRLSPWDPTTEHQLFQVSERSIFIGFFVKTRLKCLLKSVSQRPLSAAGVVAGALPNFVFQLFAELKSFQNGPCATRFYTFGRRPQPPLRQGDSLATPCSCKIWASARPKHKGSPREELRHYSTEHRLPTRKQGSQHGLLFHDIEEIKKKDRPGSASLLHLSPQTQAWPSLAQRLSLRRATTSIRQSTGSLHPPTLSYSLGTDLPLNTHKGPTLMYTHCSVSPTGRGAVVLKW
jgi:hypothetical protein